MVCKAYLAPTVLENAPELLEGLKKRAASMTWEQIAEASGVSLRTIYKWKAGEGEPGLSDFGRIAKACGVETVHDLAEFVEGPRVDEIDARTLRFIEERFGAEFGRIYSRALSAEAERDRLRDELSERNR